MDRFTGRRKLIRGSLSAPLVLTVASPAALARQSFEACLYRASQQIPDSLQVFSSQRDNWVRKELTFFKGALKTNNAAVGGATSSGIGQTASGKRKKSKDQGSGGAMAVDSGPSLERYFLREDGLYYKVQDPCGLGYSREAFDNIAEDGKEWALVYVDKSGAMHVGPCPPTGAFPVTGSCWASFGGGAVG